MSVDQRPDRPHADWGAERSREITCHGRRAIFVEGDVRDGVGKVVAAASGTCLVTGSVEPS